MIAFYIAKRDKYSVWRQNIFFWLLLVRQLIGFFDFRTVKDDDTEIFFVIKVLLIYVMITAYHSNFGISNELIRIIIIMIVYFWVGIALFHKQENSNIKINELIEKHFVSILLFTFSSFLLNFTITLIIRFYKEELIKYLYSKIE